MDVTKTAAKKKKFRLEDIVVKTVGLVDTPAVQGSEFLVTKSMEEESMQHKGTQMEEELTRQETFAPLGDAERAWARYWQSFPSERALVKHLDERPEESALFEEISSRLDVEQEIWAQLSTMPLLEAREFLDSLDGESHAGMVSIIEHGRHGLYD